MSAEIIEQLSQLLGSDFTSICPLGEDGGLSSLYRAHKESLNLDVVIKRMEIGNSNLESVKREATVMTNLRHQFLPRIFDFKTDNQGYCYTIMELIEGCTLRQYVQRNGALSQKQTLTWLKQLSQAIEYMHTRRPAIIHSDIKPENIMITNQGSICLIDFNASLEMRDQAQQAIGATPFYAAPEQYNIPLARFGDPRTLSPELAGVYNMAVAAQGKGAVTEKTDIFAIGAVAYFMITGYDPPSWNQPQISLTRYAITLSDPLRQVIERCMQAEPAQRFSSAKELQRALDSLAHMDKRYQHWRRSCRVAALVTGAGMILSLFCCLWGWLSLRQETGEAYNQLIYQAQQKGAEMDLEGQQELLMEAIKLERSRPEAYANLGALMYRMGEYQQAIELLSEIEPDKTGTLDQSQATQAQGQIQYVLASCYYHTQEYGKALSGYQIAAELCPDEPSYVRDLAVCYARQGFDEKAQQMAERLSDLVMQPGDTELVLGEIAYAAGRFEDALDALEKAARISEDHMVINRASLQAAQCCRQLGDAWIDQEIELLQNAARRLDAAENSAQMKLISDAYIRKAALEPAASQQYYGKALEILDEVMDYGQASFAVKQNKAIVLEYMGRTDEAEQLLLQMQTGYPNDYRPSMRLALIYYTKETEKDASQRNYDRFWEQYQKASTAFEMAQAIDSSMNRLQEIADQLSA